MSHTPEDSPTFRKARERIRTSKELVEKTQEILRQSREKARGSRNSKTEKETTINNSSYIQKP